MSDEKQTIEERFKYPPLSWGNRSDSISKLAAALSKAQASIEAAKKDSKNPFFNSKYADLSSVWGAIRAPLTANELSIIQEPGSEQGKVIITTTLLHSSGEYVRSSLTLPVTKADAQGYGSAITYARRYALQSVVGIAPEDDDGNAASDKKIGSNQKTTPLKDNRGNTIATARIEPINYYWYDPEQGDDKLKAAEYLKKYGAQWDEDIGLYFSTEAIVNAAKLQCDAPPM